MRTRFRFEGAFGGAAVPGRLVCRFEFISLSLLAMSSSFYGTLILVILALPILPDILLWLVASAPVLPLLYS